MHTPARWCKDIDEWSIDRPINDVGDVEGSCIHRTEFCNVTCYNIKLYKAFKGMAKKDIANEKFWQSLPTKHDVNSVSIKALQQQLFRSRRQTKRARLMSRGEGIKEVTDVFRVKILCESTPDTTWWLPTRAWRNKKLKQLIEDILFSIPNLQVNASTDPTTTRKEQKMLEESNWSTMFYGDDTQTKTLTGERRFLCPKTHKKLKGHCSLCKGGCFSQRTLGKRSDVHLSQH